MLFRSFLALALTGVIGATIGIRTAAAQTCGEQPQNLPIEVQQQIKGDAEGKAKLAVRLLGDASLSGSVESSRRELRQKYDNIDRSTVDRYFLWVTCQQIMNDRSMTTPQKLEEYQKVYRLIVAPLGQTGRVNTLLPSQPNSLVTGRLRLQFRQNGQTVMVEEGADYVQVVHLVRGPFEIMLPRAMARDIDAEKVGLRVTVSDDPALFDIARIAGEPPTAQPRARRAALRKIVGSNVSDDDLDVAPLFSPGTGSRQRARLRPPVRRGPPRDYPYGHNYIFGGRFNVDEASKRGLYVSSISLIDFDTRKEIHCSRGPSDIPGLPLQPVEFAGDARSLAARTAFAWSSTAHSTA
jgi:hypothetical protein